jgi:hypothetical protein
MKTIINFANKVRSLVDGRISNIANVEGATSAHPYTVGKQLIFNGLLCKATSAIAVGDTLAVGTNLALSDNVVEQIYSLNQGLSNSLANISHENLLDNPWFTVNQRGASSYNSGYSIDRWRVVGNAATLTVNSDSIVFTTSAAYNNLMQPIEKGVLKDGQTYTLSLLLGDGTIFSKSFVFEDSSSYKNIYNSALGGFYGAYRTTTSYIEFIIIDSTSSSESSVTIKAAKLELGAISTLHMDTAPNYQQELAKCQRYYEQNSWYSWNVKANLDGVIDVMTSYPFLVKKRVTNITTNILKQNIDNGQLVDLTTSTLIPSNEVTISQPVAYNSRMESIKITHNSIISGHTYYFSIGDDCIAFSADL